MLISELPWIRVFWERQIRSQKRSTGRGGTERGGSLSQWRFVFFARRLNPHASWFVLHPEICAALSSTFGGRVLRAGAPWLRSHKCVAFGYFFRAQRSLSVLNHV